MCGMSAKCAFEFLYFLVPFAVILAALYIWRRK